MERVGVSSALIRVIIPHHFSHRTPHQWDQFAKTGLLYGMTTNPSILLRDGVPACAPKVLAVLAAQAWNLGARELHLQAWGA